MILLLRARSSSAKKTVQLSLFSCFVTGNTGNFSTAVIGPQYVVSGPVMMLAAPVKSKMVRY
jgi:hypothetical protein